MWHILKAVNVSPPQNHIPVDGFRSFRRLSSLSDDGLNFNHSCILSMSAFSERWHALVEYPRRDGDKFTVDFITPFRYHRGDELVLLRRKSFQISQRIR